MIHGTNQSRATGFNLATAPTFAKYSYPQIALSCVTDQAPALIKKYPGLWRSGLSASRVVADDPLECNSPSLIPIHSASNTSDAYPAKYGPFKIFNNPIRQAPAA
jgi:hypothetical protein